MIVIVNIGMGNLGSIQNMIKRIGFDTEITDSKEKIINAEKIILPGVGSFDNGINNLKSADLINILSDKALNEKIPLLGICLGMQLLFDESEEGRENGLGWIKGKSKKFNFNSSDDKLKVPHMGWNYVIKGRECSLTDSLLDNSKFYFVHSYYVVCDDENNSILKSNYGFDFTCGVNKENIYGVQFHPEKSHKYGMKLLENFCKL